MNGDKAEAQFARVVDMIKQSRANCKNERVPGEFDSVHVRIIGGDGRAFSLGWTGTLLETIKPDDLWTELEVKTQGLVKKPKQ